MKTPKASTPDLRERALRYLARREHSRAELEYKLADGGAESASVLDSLECEGLLSDSRAAAAFIAAKSSRFGPRYISHYLKQRGIAADLIDAALKAIEQDPCTAVEEAWRRKFDAAPRTANDRARQIRFLQGRGFELDTILALMQRLR